MAESRFYHVAKNGNLTNLRTAAEALAAREDGFAWLDYCEPAREELAALIEPLGIHPLAIEDCLDERQIPKIEDYPDNTFMLFNAFSYAGGALESHELDVFIGKGFVITVSGRDPGGTPLLGAALCAVQADPHARLGPAYLLHVLLDQIVDRKLAAVEAIEEELNEAEESILADGRRFSPRGLLRRRRDLLTLRKSLFHEREVLVKICRRDCPYITEKAIYLYRDLYDQLTKLFELTESSREIATSLMEMYLSVLNNRMAQSANDTNVTVRRLTFITTIFMPLTLLAGIGGMSEWSMMTGPGNWRIAYPAFMAGMAVVGIASYFLLKLAAGRDERGRGEPRPGRIPRRLGADASRGRHESSPRSRRFR